MSLRGQTQGVLGNLSEEATHYNELVKAPNERFALPNQSELYRAQLRELTKKAAGQSFRRLTNLAYIRHHMN